MYVRMYVCINTAPTGCIFLKSDVCWETANSVKTGKKLSVTWIPKCFMLLTATCVVLPWHQFQSLLHCWEWHIYVNNTRGTHCLFALAKWLRERAAMLRYTYMAYLFIATIWFRLSLVYFGICLCCVKTANIALLGIGHLNWYWKTRIRNSG